MSNGARTLWVIETAIEAKSVADAERLARALAQLASEDPTFGYTRDRASTAAIVMGTDESNLDAHLTALRRIHGSDLRAGAPQVRYREALARAADADYTHRKITGAGGEFARVRLRIEPSEPGAGCAFTSEITGGVVPDEYIGGVVQGVRSVCDTGVLAGFPLDARVSFWDGAYHEIDSSWAAFEIAGRTAMQEGASQAGVKLIEPIMDVEVEMPPELGGAVIADMYKRRIRIQDEVRHGDGSVLRLGAIVLDLSTIIIGGEKRGDAIVIRGEAPLARLLGYANALRSVSGGRANCTVCFSRYAEVQRDDGPDDFSPAIGMRA